MIFEGILLFSLLFSGLYYLSGTNRFETLIGLFLISQCLLLIFLTSLNYNLSKENTAIILCFGLVLGPLIFITLSRNLPHSDIEK